MTLLDACNDLREPREEEGAGEREDGEFYFQRIRGEPAYERGGDRENAGASESESEEG